MKNWMVLSLWCAGLVAIAVGCQSSGLMASGDPSAVCPTCTEATTMAPVAGMTYTKCVCPTCKAETSIDPLLAASLRAYVGDSLGETVHVCAHCQEVVEQCPVCREKAKAVKKLYGN